MTSGAQRAWRIAPALGVLVVWAAVLLPVLDHGQPEPYDEMAMIDHARRMNTAGMYAYTLVEDASGYGKAGYSKPPGMLWLVAASMRALGNTLFAARLPSALSILALAWLALFWARRWARPGGAAGDPGDRPHDATPLLIGLLWAGLVIVSGGALHYGVTVCIEPPLVAVGLGAVTAFALAMDAVATDQALRAPGRTFAPTKGAVLWALTAGVLLGLAFLIKQLAAGVATFGVIGLAAWHVVEQRRRAPVALLVLAAAPALLIAGAWSWWLYGALGEEPFEYMFGMSVVDRAGGFQGTRHFNWLNRFSDLVDDVTAPVPVGLGVVGVLWALWRPRACEARPLGVALFLYAAAAVLFFDVISRSVLEWYAVHLLFPLAGGAAVLMGRAAGHLWNVGDRPLSSLTGVAWLELGAGAITAASVVDAAGQVLFSRLVLVSALVGLVMAVIHLARTGRAPYAAPPVLLVTAGVFVLIVGASTVRHDRWNSGLSRRAQIMAVLDAEGVEHASVDPALLGRPRALQSRQRRASFGLHATQGAWNTMNRAMDARVDLVPVPLELTPGPGARRRLIRAGGASIWLGDLSERPVTKAQVSAALGEGPLTFEAEHLPAWHLGSVIHVDDASGEHARGLAPWYRTRPARKPLAVLKNFRLPAGDYAVTFWLRWTCSRLSGTEPIVSLVASKQRRLIKCKADEEGPSTWRAVTLNMRSSRSFAPVVQAIYQRGEVAIDRIVVERRPHPDDESDDDGDDKNDDGTPDDDSVDDSDGDSEDDAEADADTDPKRSAAAKRAATKERASSDEDEDEADDEADGQADDPRVNDGSLQEEEEGPRKRRRRPPPELETKRSVDDEG